MGSRLLQHGADACSGDLGGNGVPENSHSANTFLSFRPNVCLFLFLNSNVSLSFHVQNGLPILLPRCRALPDASQANSSSCLASWSQELAFPSSSFQCFTCAYMFLMCSLSPHAIDSLTL